MARDAHRAQPEATFRLRIQHKRTKDGCQYNIPTASEIAGLIVGELDEKKI